MRRLRAGQAMVETVLAVLVITFCFFALLKLSGLLMTKIMVQHAAMRVARARAVGFNDFMCWKTAQVAVIPVAGKRLWPENEDFTTSEEAGRMRIYMESPDWPRARGLLEYEDWQGLGVNPGNGTKSTVSLTNGFFKVTGEAGIEASADYYLEGF